MSNSPLNCISALRTPFCNTHFHASKRENTVLSQNSIFRGTVATEIFSPTICLLLSRLFCLREGISDLLIWHAPEFSTAVTHAVGINSVRKVIAYPDPVAAGIVQEEISRKVGEDSRRSRGEDYLEAG